MNFIKNFIVEEDGVTAIEYALIAGLIAALIGVVVTNIGTKVKGLFNAVATAIGATPG